MIYRCWVSPLLLNCHAFLHASFRGMNCRCWVSPSLPRRSAYLGAKFRGMICRRWFIPLFLSCHAMFFANFRGIMYPAHHGAIFRITPLLPHRSSILGANFIPDPLLLIFAEIDKLYVKQPCQGSAWGVCFAKRLMLTRRPMKGRHCASAHLTRQLSSLPLGATNLEWVRLATPHKHRGFRKLRHHLPRFLPAHYIVTLRYFMLHL
jgi:hypothetical protein